MNRATRQYIVTAGLPGVGKSLIQSLLAGRVVFKPGPGKYSGTGETTEPQYEEVEEIGCCLVDTTGIEKALDAARQLTEIFRNPARGPGVFKLIFVMRCIGLRIREEDLAVANIVLEALPDVKEDHFGVILNLVDPREWRKGSAVERQLLLDTVKQGLTTTRTCRVKELLASSKFVPDDDFDGELRDFLQRQLDSNTVSMDLTLRNFICFTPEVRIEKDNVKDLVFEEEKHEKAVQEAKKMIEDLKEKSKNDAEYVKKLEEAYKEHEGNNWAKLGEAAIQALPSIATTVAGCMCPATLLVPAVVNAGVEVGKGLRLQDLAITTSGPCHSWAAINRDG